MKRQCTARKIQLTMLSCLLLALVIAAPASAKKTHLFLEVLGGAAQPNFGSPGGLAFDRASGDLLVIDQGAGTLLRFKPNGEPAPFSALGTNVIDARQGAGAKPCSEEPTSCDQTPQNGLNFDSFDQVAVDNSGAVTDGDIYVTQEDNAGGSLVDIFASDGRYIGQLTAAGGTAFNAEHIDGPCGAAIDEEGSLYLGNYTDIYKYVPTADPPVNADLSETIRPTNTACKLAVGVGPSAGLLFAAESIEGVSQSAELSAYESSGGAFRGVVVRSGQEGRFQAVSVNQANGNVLALEISSAQELLYEYGPGPATALISSAMLRGGPQGLAVDPTTGDIYISQPKNDGDDVEVYGPTVVVPDVTTEAAQITGNTEVLLSGVVNPEGAPLDECFFEYGATENYGNVVPCKPGVGEIGTSTKGVTADVQNLVPESTYHYRLVAKNNNATITGLDRSFRTPAKPAMAAQWASEVGLATATLVTTIDPENSPTSVVLEWGYGPSQSYEHATASKPAGADESDHNISFALTGLEPGREYHYRFVATNGIGVTEGNDRSFTTYTPFVANSDCPNQQLRIGSSAELSDCRAYEMVSPTDKAGGGITTLLTFTDYDARFDESAVSGDAVTFSSYRAFAGSASAKWSSQYISRRGADGWSTTAISPPKYKGSSDQFREYEFDTPFRAFSSDLSTAWTFSEEQLDPTVPGGFFNLFSRDEDGAYSAQIRAVAPHNFTFSKGSGVLPELEGVSADGRHMVFQASDNLTANAPETESSQVYEAYREGEGPPQLRLVSILPNNAPVSSGASVGFGGSLGKADGRLSNVDHALSEEGNIVYWTAAGAGLEGKGSGPGAIYLRQNGTKTLKVSETVDTSPARFWDAATDGSASLYDFTAGTHAGQLYLYKLAEKKSTLVAGKFEGLLGASDDLLRFYFVSEEELAAGSSAGMNNLYFSDNGAITYVAALSNEDVKSGFKTPFPVATQPYFHVARVTPDGHALVFLSDSPALAQATAGYDNTDQVGEQPDEEVYRYTSTDGVTCVSCNPTGARPRGREEVFGSGQHLHRWAAASIPGYAMQTYQPRYVSDDGTRVFFESYERLVAQDTDGTADVYEWEAPGSGDCSLQSSSYARHEGGCVSLVSTGESPADSELIDASPNGRDIFFVTLSSLVGQDAGSVDLYDARELGGFFPAEKVASCEGEACQGLPQLVSDLSPSSSLFTGAGNLAASTTKSKPAAKPAKKAKKRKKKRPRKAKKSRSKKRSRNAIRNRRIKG